MPGQGFQGQVLPLADNAELCSAHYIQDTCSWSAHQEGCGAKADLRASQGLELGDPRATVTHRQEEGVTAAEYRKYKATFHVSPPTGASPHPACISALCRLRSQFGSSGVAHSGRMSQYLTLYAGDVLWMSTDGHPENMNDDEVREVESNDIGILRNPVVRQR